MNIIDRRLNPKGKSLGNRQRFLRAPGPRSNRRCRRRCASARSPMSSTARRSRSRRAASRSRSSITAGAPAAPSMSCPATRSSSEATRSRGRTAARGGAAREGSPDGEGEDDFGFTLSREEFLDIFFEDLELPDLVKQSLKETTAVDLQRAGYTVTGTPPISASARTMRNSMARRIALRRPKLAEIEAPARRRSTRRCARDDEEDAERLTRELERIERRSKIIPYIDPSTSASTASSACRCRTPRR